MNLEFIKVQGLHEEKKTRKEHCLVHHRSAAQLHSAIDHEIDIDAALIEDWEAKGHKLGTLRGMGAVDGDSGESSSKVIKRQLERKSATFLFK